MAQPAQLHFEFITDAAPVQAEGMVAGRPFYFRARHEAWDFVVAEQPGLHPAALDAADIAAGRAWMRSGVAAGRRGAASYMPLSEASALITGCIHEYLAEKRDRIGELGGPV